MGQTTARAHEPREPAPPGRRGPGPRWAGAAAAALLLPMASCAADPGTADTADLMSVVADAPEGPVSEWTGTAADFDGHPYVPDGVTVTAAYPEFEGAEGFSQGLSGHVDRRVGDFYGGSREPVSLDIDWEVTAAGDGVLGVRLVHTVEDLHGLRQGYATYWYDAETGLTRYSSELIAGREGLEQLNGIVADALADHPHAGADTLWPILSTYDSMGFNADGDLVVEFDDGHLSPVREGHPPDASPGRIGVVVDADEAAPLLSDLGERARAASALEEPDFAVPVPDAPNADRPAVPGEITAGEDVDCAAEGVRCVALTFDDGPAETTPHLLDLLAEEGVVATFFLNGDPALTRPAVIRRAYAEGHEIANHNDQHEHMRDLPVSALPRQVATVNAIVSRETGYRVTLFRPPFGQSSPEVLAEVGAQEMAQVVWNVDSEDWTEIGPNEIVERVTEQTARADRDAIVLLHDPLPATLAAVPELIGLLREDGYTFATTTQAIGDPVTGAAYPEGRNVPEAASGEPKA